MRHGVLIGSAAAVLLVGAVTAVVLHRGGPTEGGIAVPQIAAVSPDGAAPRAGARPGSDIAPQPPPMVPPSFDIVKVGPTGTAVIAGRAEPGSTVTVRDGDKIIGEVTADRRGEWVLVPQQPIGPGDRLLSLEAANRQSGAVVKSDETVALSIAPAASDGKGESALAVVLPRDGGAAARVLQRPGGVPGGATPAQPDTPATATPNALSMDTVEYDAQGRVALSGHATPGATVQIYIGNEPVATATADTTGIWTARSARPVGGARAELRLDQLGKDGRVAQRVTLPLARPTAAELAAGEDYVVRPGNSLWQIARRTYGNGVRYLIIYSANLGQIRDPDRIYPGQVFKLPKT